MTAAAVLIPALTAPLVQHRACDNCRMPVNDQGMSTRDEGPGSRGWIHTLTGMYRCADPYAEGDGYAAPGPDSEQALESARDEAYQVGEETGREEGYDEGRDEGHTEGVKEGRAQMRDELDFALSGALDGLIPVSPGGDTVSLEHVRAMLTDAWERCLA